MAKRKKAAKKKPARKKVAKRKAAPRKKAGAKKKSAKRAPAKRAARKPAAKPPAPAPVSRIGIITHTELASADPAATQTWTERVLGWKYMDDVPTDQGPYRMWRFANDTGGGLRGISPQEPPGTIPYVEVAGIQATHAAALAAGATEIAPPMELPGGMGWISIVTAPGGVAIGFWAMK